AQPGPGRGESLPGTPHQGVEHDMVRPGGHPPQAFDPHCFMVGRIAAPSAGFDRLADALIRVHTDGVITGLGHGTAFLEHGSAERSSSRVPEYRREHTWRRP